MQTITKQKAIERLDAFLVKNGLEADAKDAFSGWHGIYLKFNSGTFSDEATVDCRLDNGKLRMEISWSSSRRTLAAATTALANYHKAIEVAAKLQTFFEELPVIVEETVKGSLDEAI